MKAKIDSGLAPCPFCGGKVVMNRGMVLQLPIYLFTCLNKNCGAKVSFANAETEAVAVSAMKYWQKRITKGGE